MSNTRKITVYSTKVGKTVVETAVTIWGDLKELISNKYDLNTLVATENKTKTNLESFEAALPETDFILYLRPRDNKNATSIDNMSFKEMRQLVKENNNLKSFLQQKGNYTQFNANLLKHYIKEFAQNDNSTTPGILDPSKETVQKAEPTNQITDVSKETTNCEQIVTPEDTEGNTNAQDIFVEVFFRSIDTDSIDKVGFCKKLLKIAFGDVYSSELEEVEELEKEMGSL
jgi:hypothetical protein